MQLRFYAGIGSRQTPPEILAKMQAIAAQLEARGFVLRSGGADGADTAFELGCTAKEIFLPWPGFNGRSSPFDRPSKAAFELAAQTHPAFDRLSAASRKLMARNGHQVLGATLDQPVSFVLCWTPDGAESEAQRTRETGGTGQAIALASRHGIPVFNLANRGALNRVAALLHSLDASH